MPELCRAIVKGFVKQLRTDSATEATRQDASTGRPVFNLEILAADPEGPKEHNDTDWTDWKAEDDVHGGVLPAKLVY